MYISWYCEWNAILLEHFVALSSRIHLFFVSNVVIKMWTCLLHLIRNNESLKINNHNWLIFCFPFFLLWETVKKNRSVMPNYIFLKIMHKPSKNCSISFRYTCNITLLSVNVISIFPGNSSRFLNYIKKRTPKLEIYTGLKEPFVIVCLVGISCVQKELSFM